MMNKLLFFCGILFLTFSVFSQEVKATLNKKNVQVGEPFQIKYEIELDPTDTFEFKPKTKTLRAFLENEKSKSREKIAIDITSKFVEKREKIQGKYYWIGTYQVSAFEEGIVVIEPEEFTFNKKKIFSNPLIVFVELVPVNKKIDLHDIQEHFIEIKTSFFEKYKQEILWSSLFAVIGGLVLLYFYLISRYKKSKELTPSPATFEDKKDLAIQNLNALMEKELWTKGELKQHFTELSLIVRRYLTTEIGESYLEKTSLEIQLQLRNRSYRESLINPLGLILNVSDMVKFAKSSLEKDGIFKIYQEAKSFIVEFEEK